MSKQKNATGNPNINVEIQNQNAIPVFVTNNGGGSQDSLPPIFNNKTVSIRSLGSKPDNAPSLRFTVHEVRGNWALLTDQAQGGGKGWVYIPNVEGVWS